MTQKQKTHRIAVAALLAAVAAVLQFVEFSIPVMPAFIKLDISDLPALLGTFSLGPVYGVAIQLVKNLLHLPFGSSAGVGVMASSADNIAYFSKLINIQTIGFDKINQLRHVLFLISVLQYNRRVYTAPQNRYS